MRSTSSENTRRYHRRRPIGKSLSLTENKWNDSDNTARRNSQSGRSNCSMCDCNRCNTIMNERGEHDGITGLALSIFNDHQIGARILPFRHRIASNTMCILTFCDGVPIPISTQYMPKSI